MASRGHQDAASLRSMISRPQTAAAWELASSRRLPQPHGGQHRPEVGLPLPLSMQLTRATIRWIVAATIHDARRAVDEPHIRGVESTVDPGFELVDVVIWGGIPVISCRSGIGLHRVQPIEKASDPLQLRRRARLANRIRVGAEVDLGEQSIPAFNSGSSAQVVIQFTEVANSGRLDDAATPPTTSLQICASDRLPEERRR